MIVLDSNTARIKQNIPFFDSIVRALKSTKTLGGNVDGKKHEISLTKPNLLPVYPFFKRRMVFTEELNNLLDKATKLSYSTWYGIGKSEPEQDKYGSIWRKDIVAKLDFWADITGEMEKEYKNSSDGAKQQQLEREYLNMESRAAYSILKFLTFTLESEFLSSGKDPKKNLRARYIIGKLNEMKNSWASQKESTLSIV